MMHKLSAAISDFNMLKKGDTVVVGVSGGADSMCLVSLLSENAEAFGIEVIAAHFNHGIRGKEADRDESFVKDYCDKNKIKFVSARCDVPSEAVKTGESLEECARRLRYDFLFGVFPGARIATAHTSSDSIETVLMNFSRGSGLHGLCGIPPVRDSIIRPLIYFTRDDTESYCREHSVDYITDSTNLSADYTRNAFRLKVIPEIKRINPSFSSNALRCMSIIREEDEYLSNEAENVLRNSMNPQGDININLLAACGDVILRRATAMFVSSKINRDVSFSHIMLICEMIRSGRGAVQLPGGEKLVCDKGRLFFEQPKTQRCEYLEIKIPENGGCFNFYGRIIGISFSDELPEAEKGVFIAAFPDMKTLLLRSRREGDCITLTARRCTKSLKKLFCEEGIPPEKRNSIPVLADDNGVIFVDGFGVNNIRCPENKEKKYMIIKTRWGNNE